MFEVAELGRKVDKQTFKAESPKVREGLLDCQFRLKEDPRFRVVVLVGGVEAAGKGALVNLMLEWMDARGISTHAIGRPTAEELERPRFFRFWRRLPSKGKAAIFLGNWYTFPIVDRVFERHDEGSFEREMRRINAFEKMLVDEDTLLLKYWLHISKEEQRERIDKLASDPTTAWRISERDQRFAEKYDDFVHVTSKALRITSQGHAPWNVVEATDRRYRDLSIHQHMLAAFSARLDEPPAHTVTRTLPAMPQPVNIINTLDLSKSLKKADYKEQLRTYQGRIGRLSRRLREAGRSVVLVFEGSDAAGKGGAIRRVIRAIDARFYRVIPISAPTDEELSLPYLWRFWRYMPRQGYFTVFDRSWYGRVLVERVEGFAAPDVWRRAFAEINEFEEQMVESGVIVVKFWLAISAEEQLKRFKAREATGYKRYKLTDEDWRNRDKAPRYEAAAAEMIAKTSTELAPWTLVEAEDKRYARVKVVKTVSDAMEAALGPDELPAQLPESDEA